MRWCKVSEMYRLPRPSTATPLGEDKLAEVGEPPSPSTLPPPATVVTAPWVPAVCPGAILRMRALLTSATYMLPWASNTICCGALNSALRAVLLLVAPAVPFPAVVPITAVEACGTGTTWKLATTEVQPPVQVGGFTTVTDCGPITCVTMS